MKRGLLLLVVVLVLQSWAALCEEPFGSSADLTILAPKPSLETRRSASRTAGPIIYADKTEVGLNEYFTISWDEPDADVVSLFIMRDDDTEFECVYSGACSYSYRTTLEGSLRITFCAMVLYGDVWEQSNMLDVCIGGSTAGILRNRGYDSTWNILVLIFPEVDTGTFKASWDENYVARIKSDINELPHTLNGLSKGKMTVGRMSIHTIDEVLTSVSGAQNDLTYGEDGDVNFNYLFDHLDVQLVIVYAPLGDISKNWAGLGGSWIAYNGNKYLNIILNCVYEKQTTWTNNGQSYRVAVCLPLHEVLHSVETNSRQNGWTGFVGLHDNLTCGYDSDPDYDYIKWYADLMADEIQTGDPGFREESYLVKHKRISEDMRSGVHMDSDGRIRLYSNGLPDLNTLITQYEGKWYPVQKGELIKYEKMLCTPKRLAHIEANAFRGVDVQWVELNASLVSVGNNAFAECLNLVGVVVPSTVSYISPDAFSNSPHVVLYAINNPYVEQYAQKHQMKCISVP